MSSIKAKILMSGIMTNYKNKNIVGFNAKEGVKRKAIKARLSEFAVINHG